MECGVVWHLRCEKEVNRWISHTNNAHFIPLAARFILIRCYECGFMVSDRNRLELLVYVILHVKGTGILYCSVDIRGLSDICVFSCILAFKIGNDFRTFMLVDMYTLWVAAVGIMIYK